MLNELLNGKSALEESCAKLREEKEAIRQQILRVRKEKADYRKQRVDLYRQLNNLKIDVIDMEKRVQFGRDYVDNVNECLRMTEESIKDNVRLKELEARVMKLKQSMSSAMNFYSSENLQMELMKRTNNVREKRVEYTKKESEYNEILRKIEEQKREKERAQLAEQERARQEEEDRMRKEEEKKREEFLQMREGTNFANPSFLGRIQSPQSFDVGSSDTSCNDTTYTSTKDKSSASSLPDLSFSYSQLLNWK